MKAYVADRISRLSEPVAYMKTRSPLIDVVARNDICKRRRFRLLPYSYWRNL